MANSSLSAPVAQLDRALASGAKGCGFDPRRAQVRAALAFFSSVASIPLEAKSG